jgi:hypothetical protein
VGYVLNATFVSHFYLLLFLNTLLWFPFNLTENLNCDFQVGGSVRCIFEDEKHGVIVSKSQQYN